MRALLLGVMALVGGAAGWYFGADVWHAALLVTAVAVVAFAARRNASVGEPRDLWWAPEDPLCERGARDEIARLAQSLGEGIGTAGHLAEVRVRLLARRRLASHGLDLSNRQDHPEIVALLGSEAARAVLREHIMGIRTKTLLGVLDALDRLDRDAEPPRG